VILNRTKNGFSLTGEEYSTIRNAIVQTMTIAHQGSPFCIAQIGLLKSALDILEKEE
jgi:hypothetical protein